MAADSKSDESLRSVTPSSEHEEYKRMLQIEHTNPQGCGALCAQGDFFLETDRLSEKRLERSAHENLTPKSSRCRGVSSSCAAVESTMKTQTCRLCLVGKSF